VSHLDLEADGDRRHANIGPPPGLTDRRRRTKSGLIATDAMKMACPFCGGSESAVVRSEGRLTVSEIARTRECATCGERFYTSETVDTRRLSRQLAERATKGQAGNSNS
jgi:hypothetical protein